MLLGGAWLQRFQGLDRHRPVEALPEVVGTGPFLPPFVGMTPLATDGPGSGSGAGFGRDHAEKWQSGGVSHTTPIVTKTTSTAGLNPASTRTCALFPIRPPRCGPRRRAQAPYRPLSRTGHTRQRQTVPLGSIIARTERDLIVDRFVWGRSCGRGRLSSSVVCVRALGGSALWAWASWPSVTCVRALAGMPTYPRAWEEGGWRG